MSLKAFHIVFIVLSIALAFGFSVWLLQSYARANDGWLLVGGIASILAGIALIMYCIRILRKLKNVSYL